MGVGGIILGSQLRGLDVSMGWEPEMLRMAPQSLVSYSANWMKCAESRTITASGGESIDHLYENLTF